MGEVTSFTVASLERYFRTELIRRERVHVYKRSEQKGALRRADALQRTTRSKQTKNQN